MSYHQKYKQRDKRKWYQYIHWKSISIMETIQLTLLRIISTITRSWRFMWWWVSSISSILATQKNACREEYQRCYRYEEEECSYGFGRAWLLNLHFICLPCRPCTYSLIVACMVVNGNDIHLYRAKNTCDSAIQSRRCRLRFPLPNSRSTSCPWSTIVSFAFHLHLHFTQMDDQKI